MTFSQPDRRNTQMTGRLRVVLQAGSLVLLVGLMAPFAASLPLRWRQLMTLVSAADSPSILGTASLEAAYLSRLGPAELAALHALGLSLPLYAGYLLTLEVCLALICVGVGVFIFWRRSDNWLALWVFLLLVILGTSSISPELATLAIVRPGWVPVVVGAGILGMVGHLHLLFLAPDGKFVPRWTQPLAAGFTGAVLVLAAYGAIWARSLGFWANVFSFILSILLWVILLGVGTFSQVYRYRYVSSPMERQQTKWVVWGLTGVLVGVLANAWLFLTASQATGLARVWVNLARPLLVYLCLLALPISLAFSILRYKLWDIDLLIRRTLIYSILTAALVVIYFSSVVALQALVGRLTGESRPPLVTVLSTLAIAALFIPLRRRVQDIIDRRFYRRQFDAARTLASFAAGARDEVELEHLSRRLLEVVQDTMQPAHVSLWLKPSAGRLHTPGERLTGPTSPSAGHRKSFTPQS